MKRIPSWFGVRPASRSQLELDRAEDFIQGHQFQPASRKHIRWWWWWLRLGPAPHPIHSSQRLITVIDVLICQHKSSPAGYVDLWRQAQEETLSKRRRRKERSIEREGTEGGRGRDRVKKKESEERESYFCCQLTDFHQKVFKKERKGKERREPVRLRFSWGQYNRILFTAQKITSFCREISRG